MRAVAQRVRASSVTVGDAVVGRIEHGLLAYVGAQREDSADDLAYIANKLVNLRIFEDDRGKMSLSVLEAGGGVLLVPQFTLFGDVRRGRRPSFDDAELPERARELFDQLVAEVTRFGAIVATGRFREEMLVEARVAGPVTILLDSRKVF
ncbi:MAG: D-tyrosyl-tRNA(Tyr) deacylase [Sandaracinaceae bacterium]|nr:D-tyrosyl-tRNA(Tyr) deacylase [Sandaracinaceae bacterium]